LRLSGEPEILAEETVELLLLQLDNEQTETGVEEVWSLLQVAGDLGLSLTQPRHWIEQIAVRTAEYPVSTEHTRSHLLTDVELSTGGVLSVVARLAAGVQREGGH